MAPSTLLATLQARPPTPPKDFSSSDPVVHESKGLSATLLDTPETPTAFVPEYFASKPPSRGTKRKRVNFILTPTHHASSDLPSSPPSLPAISPGPERPPLLPRHSNSLAKPTKSILKAARNGLLSDTSLGSDDLKTLVFKSDRVKMIDDICHQLESPDKSSRLSAYQSLFSTLREDPDIADLDEFKRRLSALAAYVQRDLRSSGGSDHRDGQIAVEALKVMNTLAWKDVLPDSLLASLLDWCISALFDCPSKAVVNNVLLHLTCIKSDKIFTASRASKLFDALKDLHLRVKGKQVLILRLDIYRKLLAQKQPPLISGARVWLRHLLDALLKDKKEFAQHALALGREAAVRFGTSKEISRSLVAVFSEPASSSNEEVEDGRQAGGKTFATLFLTALNGFLAERDKCERVPQTWSMVVLFLRHRSAHFRKWDHWGQWLTLLQKCFNSSDSNLKGLANRAWRDLIWASQDEILLDPAVRKTLLRPILGQMERDREKAEAESAFCTLVYYTLRPGTGTHGMKVAWEEYVLKAFDSTKPGVSTFAAAVLHSLLGSDEQKKTWDRDMALQPQKMGPDSLLRFDPQWICANIGSILSVIDRHVCSSSTEIDESGSDVVDLQMGIWDRLLGSVAEVGRREVRPSTLTVRSIASVVTFAFGRIADALSDVRSYQLAVRLLAVLIGYSGNLPLNHRCLLQSGTQILAVSNGSGGEVSASSALELILGFLAPSCTSVWAMSTCADQFSRAVDARLGALSTKHASLAALATISDLCLCDHADGAASETHLCQKQFLWSDVACRFAEIIKDTTQDSPGSQQYGEDLSGGVQILVNGLGQGVNVADDWESTLHELAAVAESVSGAAGLASAVIAPLADEMRGKRPSDSHIVPVAFYQKLLELIPAPVGQSDMTKAQKMLWGASMPHVDCRNDPFGAIFAFLAHCLSSSDDSLILSAAQSWNKIQSLVEEIDVPEDLLLALKRAARITHIDRVPAAGVIDGAGHPNSGTAPDSSPDSPGSPSEDIVVPPPTFGNSPGNQMAIESLPRASKESPLVSLRNTPPKPFFSARIDDLAVDLPSSPPDFHLPRIPLPHRDMDDEALLDDAPLPTLPSSDEAERLDSSPTPAPRRPSHAQSDLGALALPSSSPFRLAEKLRIRSDPLGESAVSLADSTPTRAQRSRTRRHRKEKTNNPNEVFGQAQDDGKPLHQRQEEPVDEQVPAAEISAATEQEMVAAAGAVEQHNVPKRRTSLRKRARETSMDETRGQTSTAHPNQSEKAVTRSSKLAKTVNIDHLPSEVTVDASGRDEGGIGTKRAKGRSRKSTEKSAANSRINEPKSKPAPTGDESDLEDCIIVGSYEIPKTSQAPQFAGPETPHRSPRRPASATPSKAKSMQDRLTDSHTSHAIAEEMPSRTPRSTSHKRKRRDGYTDTEKSVVENEPERAADASPSEMKANVEHTEQDEPQRPSKKQRLSLDPNRSPQTPETRTRSATGTPASALSQTAQNILSRLRGLLGDVQKAVLGRSEAREIHRTLNELNSAAMDAEERGG